MLYWLLKMGDLFIWLLFGLFLAWTVGAIYYWPDVNLAIRLLLLAALLLSMVWLFRKCTEFSVARSLSIGLMAVVMLSSLILIRPSNDRIWAADHTRVAAVSIEDDVVSIENFRNCRYRSELDYDLAFETKQFPLAAIESVWLVVQKFTAGEGLAHVFLSFGLDDGQYFSVSVEIRREAGEAYSPLRGVYRNYELTHVIGDERDLIGVRTVFRPQDRVYLYRINATAEQSQRLFQEFADRIASLNRSPQFYHTLLNNCANGITGLTYELTPEPINWLDPRIVMPGHSAEFGFANSLLGDRSSGESFESLEARSRIDEIAEENGISDDFSLLIRRLNE